MVKRYELVKFYTENPHSTVGYTDSFLVTKLHKDRILEYNSFNKTASQYTGDLLYEFLTVFTHQTFDGVKTFPCRFYVDRNMNVKDLNKHINTFMGKISRILGVKKTDIRFFSDCIECVGQITNDSCNEFIPISYLKYNP